MGKMPSLVENKFSENAAQFSICHNLEQVDVDVCDEVNIMLVCAYIELILPMISIIGSFFFLKEAGHVMGSNIPALCSVVSGSLYLALNYGDAKDYFGDMGQGMFKAHVALSMTVAIVGALCMLQVTLSFLQILACGSCCEGERVMGLLAFVFTMIGLVVIFSVPIGTMAIGWTYAFGDCSDSWKLFYTTWKGCNLNSTQSVVDSQF